MSTSGVRRDLLLASIAGVGALASGCATPRAPADAENFIVDRSKDWTDCYVTGRTEAMEMILADEFVSTDPSGARLSKQEALAAARQGPSSIASIRMGPMKVKIFGNAAIALGGDVVEMKTGPSRTLKTAYTDTWLLREGRWQCVASHESILEPSAKQ